MFGLFKKREDMKVRVIQSTLDLRITGKVTRPQVRVTDPAFDAKKYLHTNLADTFARAREQQARNKPRSAA